VYNFILGKLVYCNDFPKHVLNIFIRTLGVGDKQVVILLWDRRVFEYHTMSINLRGRRGRWIYNYFCNQCLSPLKLWVRTPFIARCTRYNIMW